MSFLFLMLSALFFFDLCRLLLFLVDKVSKKRISEYLPSTRTVFISACTLSIGILIYGSYEASNIQVEHITVSSSKLPAGSKGIRIVQISDLHLGLIIRGSRLDTVLSRVKEAKADLIVSTGDLVDGQMNGLNGLAEKFHALNPKYGKFAVTGNHEYYAGLNQALEFTRRAGFTMLRGRTTDIAEFLTLAGVDDSTGRQFNLFKGSTEDLLLRHTDQSKFILLLKHRPAIEPLAINLFDLQLSGHTHKGQIFPFSLITWFHYGNDSGYMKITENSARYISRGAGTWGPPIRFLSPPEITIIDLVPKQ
ncbi:MAG: metallophosphoesterase [Nitrospira sp.]|nr:metallophosphoesterase [Nitrospira sp.]